MDTVRTFSGWTAALLLTVSIVPWAGAAAADVTEKLANGAVNWSTGVLTVTGAGAPPAKGGAAQKRLMAVRAAQVDGYRQIAEAINGVRVDSETVVKDFVTESDTIRTQVSALVKGARTSEPRYLSDGSVEVTVTVPMYGNDGLADAVDLDRQGRRRHRRSALPVTADLGSAGAIQPLGLLSQRSYFMAAGGMYTGVIVDCSAVHAQPAMSPSILDDSHTELYVGNLPVDADLVVNQGIVGYRPSVAAAKADQNRVGANPLVLTARAVEGRFRADVVLSSEGSAALLAANQANPFLAQTKVAFVIQK